MALPSEDRPLHQLDAFAIAKWMQGADREGSLKRHLMTTALAEHRP